MDDDFSELCFSSHKTDVGIPYMRPTFAPDVFYAVACLLHGNSPALKSRIVRCGEGKMRIGLAWYSKNDPVKARLLRQAFAGVHGEMILRYAGT